MLVSLAAVLFVGFLLDRSRLLSWLLVIAVVAGAHLALHDEAPGFRMVALLILLCYGMKAVVVAEARRAGMPRLSLGSWAWFAALWLGMQPREFAEREALPIPGSSGLLWRGVLWIAAGCATLVLARHLHQAGTSLRIAGLIFVAGCSMTLHFGILGLLATGLRRRGYRVGPQFHAPWRSRSLHDFWSRRWNAAFSVMTTLAVYRPTVSYVGRNGALCLCFVGSGLFHEIACSLPVHAGYGLPTAYFTLHGFAILIERWLHRRGTRLEGPAATLWVYGWVLLPLPLLFHMPFLAGLVQPLL